MSKQSPNESAAGLKIDFDQELPEWNFFPVHWLAKEWHCSGKHICNLIDTDELKIGIDLRGLKSSRAMIRVPRKSLVEFLNARQNREAIREANPRPKWRAESKRRARALTKGKSR